MATEGPINQLKVDAINAAQWFKVTQFFANNPAAVKMSRKKHDLPFSFIKVEGVIYAMDRKYLGFGGYSKVKKVMTREGEFLKVNISAVKNTENVREVETIIAMRDKKEEMLTAMLGESRGKASRTFDTEKNFWKALVGTSDEKPHTLMTNQIIYKILNLRDGGDLFEALDHDIYNDAEVTVIAVQCAKEVQRFHEQDLIHGDIKPQNFIIDKNLTVSLIDFGTLKRLADGQSSVIDNNKSGTKHFWAPEISDKGEFSFASDIYALGLMFLEYFGLNFAAMLDPNPANRPPIKDVIMMFSKSVEDYYAAELTTSLQETLESQTPPLKLNLSGVNLDALTISTPKLSRTTSELDLAHVVSPRPFITSSSSSDSSRSGSPFTFSPSTSMQFDSPGSSRTPSPFTLSMRDVSSQSPSPYPASPRGSRSGSPCLSPRSAMPGGSELMQELTAKISSSRLNSPRGGRLGRS